MSFANNQFFDPADCIPSLRGAFGDSPPDPKRMLKVALKLAKDTGLPPQASDNFDRSELVLTSQGNVWFWRVESLRALFRGDKIPPVLGDYPESYNDSFVLLDLHALQLGDIVGDPRDVEMREIYATLRRRPDGRSLNFNHDYMWQVAAMVLGTRPLSEAEFSAIMARVERSCRTFSMGPSSRNYVASLRKVYGGK